MFLSMQTRLKILDSPGESGFLITHTLGSSTTYQWSSIIGQRHCERHWAQKRPSFIYLLRHFAPCFDMNSSRHTADLLHSELVGRYANNGFRLYLRSELAKANMHGEFALKCEPHASRLRPIPVLRFVLAVR